MRERLVPRRMAEALARSLPRRVGERVRAELVPEFARLAQAGRVAEAERYWCEGVDRIAAEVLVEVRHLARELEVEGSA